MLGYSEVLSLLLSLAVFCLPSATQSTCDQLTNPETENFVIHPQDREVELNNMVVFNCQYNSLGSTVFFRWEFYQQGGAIFSISSNSSFPNDYNINMVGSLIIPRVRLNHTGIYVCLAMPIQGCIIFSDNASLLVISEPSVAVDSIDICHEATEIAEITGQVVGYPTATVHLYRMNDNDGMEMVDESRVQILQPSVHNANFHIFISDLLTTDQGIYAVQATNTEGISEPVHVNLTVKVVDPCEDMDCHHSCIVHEGTPRCFCDYGNMLADDKKTCIDINECSHRNGNCSDICINDIGTGYHCGCPDNEKLGEDGYSCEDTGLICHYLSCNDTNVCDTVFENQYCDDSDSGSGPAHCQATYKLRPDGTFKPRLLSCFAGRFECPSKNECIADEVKDNIYYCCCDENYCNANVRFPSLTPQPSVTQPTGPSDTNAVGTSRTPTGDIDECSTIDPCDLNAACTNTDGSFTCSCNSGYFGDGFDCSAALSFIPLSTPVFVPRGDETYSGTVYPDVIFPFGTTTVTNIYVSNNGYFSMGETPQYASLNTFSSFRSYSIVAPFAANIDTSSTGYVRYSESFSSQLSVVSEYIRSETVTSFYGTWMLVAEWNGVPLLGISTSITNTFQGILISDGTTSYAVFIYDCSNMEWGGGVIGWQQSTTQYASHDTSRDSDSNEVVCEYQTSSFTTLVYRINSAAGSGVKGQIDPGIIGGSIAAGVCVVLFLAFAITLLCILKRHRFSTKRKAVIEIQRSPFLMKEFKRQQKLQKYIIPQNSIRILNIIGEGEFGIVYRAHQVKNSLQSVATIPVAVKMMKGFSGGEKPDDLFKEALQMHDLDHRNVMTLVGVYFIKSDPCIVMPYMEKGSLLTHLKKERDNLIVSETASERVQPVSKTLLGWSLQVAEGMQYLASKKIVHKDLAARNCMLGENMVIKVADFGFSENMYTCAYVRTALDGGVKLPVKWMAPESILDGVFSEKTDVWSFGVTCWEIFTGGVTPYPGVASSAIPRMRDKERWLDQPDNKACSDEIYDMMVRCWDGEPAQRPTFSDLVTDIASQLDSLAGGYLKMAPV